LRNGYADSDIGISCTFGAPCPVVFTFILAALPGVLAAHVCLAAPAGSWGEDFKANAGAAGVDKQTIDERPA